MKSFNIEAFLSNITRNSQKNSKSELSDEISKGFAKNPDIRIRNNSLPLRQGVIPLGKEK